MLFFLFIFMFVAKVRCGRTGTGTNSLFAFSFANLKNDFYLALIRADTNRNNYVDRLIRSYNQFVLLPYYIPEIPTFRTKDMAYTLQAGALILYLGVLLLKEFFTNIINYNNMDTLHYCPLCGKEVIKSETEGYAYQCPDCDEDFYLFEVITIKAKK